MKIAKSDPKEEAGKLLAGLRGLKGDRGAMADLRRALLPAQRHRAWPLLARFGGIDRPVYETVAGLFGHHPQETFEGNLGRTCRELSREHNSFEGRFKRLLSCDREDICRHVRSIVLAAAARNIPVNYERLFTDLCYWSGRVKSEWAKEFWGLPSEESVPGDAEDES